MLKCWLTGWVVLSGLIGAWFLYVKWWFDFSFGTHFGNSGWCFWWWVSILAALIVPWAPFLMVLGVFWVAFWELWASLWLHFERPGGLQGALGGSAVTQRPPRRPGPNFPKFSPPFWEPFWTIFGRKNRSKNQSIFQFIFRVILAQFWLPKCLPKPSKINKKSIKNEGQISSLILLCFFIKFD